MTIPVSVSDTSEANVGTSNIVFTSATWNISQTVNVNGVDDQLADGDQTYTVQFAAATSLDADYAGLTVAALSFVNVDNENAGFTVSPLSGPTSEAEAPRPSLWY